MKTVVIYHSIDLDGWMSAAIVKHYLLEKAVNDRSGFKSYNSIEETDFSIENVYTFIGYNYGQPIPDLSEYDKVIMTDISFPEKEMNELYSKLGANFIWIDHHVSAINDINNNDIEGYRLLTYAACELTWKYFFPSENMPEIVRLLGRYDCFGHKDTIEETKVLEFQYGARDMITNYEEAYDILYKIISFPKSAKIMDSIYNNGVSIYKHLVKEAKSIYKNGIPIILDNKRFLAINRERFNPINFGIDYHKDNYQGVMSFYLREDRVWSFSLYNDDGMTDVSLIAKQFKGGGHKGAAGFVLPLHKYNIDSFLRARLTV